MPTSQELVTNRAYGKSDGDQKCVDGSLSTSSVFNANLNNYIALDSGVDFQLKQIKLVANGLASQYVNVPFNVYASEAYSRCTMGESFNFDSFLLVKGLSFTAATQVISLNVTGVKARFVIIGTGSPFNHKVAPPVISLTEIIVNGELTDSNGNALTWNSFPSNLRWWQKSLDLINILNEENFRLGWSDRFDGIYPSDYQQACLQMQWKSCYGIIGQYGSGRYAFTTTFSLFTAVMITKKYPKSQAALYSFFQSNSSWVKNDLSAAAKGKLVLITYEWQNPNVTQILQALSNGQAIWFAKTLFGNSPAWMQQLYDALNIGRNVLDKSDQMWVDQNTELTSIIPPMKVIKEAYTNRDLFRLLNFDSTIVTWLSKTAFWQQEMSPPPPITFDEVLIPPPASLPANWTWWQNYRIINDAMVADGYSDGSNLSLEGIFPMDYQQACIQSYNGLCSIVVGQYGKGRFLMMKDNTLWTSVVVNKPTKYSKTLTALNKFFGTEADKYLMETFGPDTMGKLVYLSSKSAMNNVDDILSALSNGQSFFFAKLNFWNETAPWMRDLFDRLQIGRNVLDSSDIAFGLGAKTGSTVDLGYVPAKVLVDSFSNVGLLASTPYNPIVAKWLVKTSYIVQSGLSKTILSEMPMKLNRVVKYHCPCNTKYVNPGTDEANLMNTVGTLVYDNLMQTLTRPLSCSMDFPIAPSYFAQKDTIIVRVKSIWSGRYVNSGAAVGAQQPFGYRVLSGDPSRFFFTIGCNRDNVQNVGAPFRKWPNVVYDLNQKNPNQMIITKFAGTFYIRPSYSDNSELVLQLYNVYETAELSRKAIDEAKWLSTKARTSAGFMHFEGNIFDACPGIYMVQNNDYNSIIASIAIMDSWVVVDHNYVGTDRNTAGGELMNLDRQITVGWGHSGYPWSAYELWTNWNATDIQKNGFWGLCHEVGHNRVMGAFQLPDNTEVTNNILCWVDYNVTTSIPSFRSGADFYDMGSMVKLWKSGNWSDRAGFAQNTYFGYIATKWGIYFWSKFFHLMLADTRSWPSMWDKYVVVMSEMTQLNWSPYHVLNAWTLASTTLSATAKYPCYMPDDEFTAQAATRIASIKAQFNVTCTSADMIIPDVHNVSAQIYDVFRPKDNNHFLYSAYW